MARPHKKERSYSYSKVLLAEEPRIYQFTVAKVLGIPKAIILQQILYWQLNTSDQGRWAKDKFGVQRKWIYNTSKDWEEQLPLDWTTIRDNLHDLAEETLRVDTWQGQEQAEVPFLYVEQWSKSKGIMTN